VCFRWTVRLHQLRKIVLCYVPILHTFEDYEEGLFISIRRVIYEAEEDV